MEGLEEWITVLLSMPCGKSANSPSLGMMANGRQGAYNSPRGVWLMFRHKLECNGFYENMAACVFF